MRAIKQRAKKEEQRRLTPNYKAEKHRKKKSGLFFKGDQVSHSFFDHAGMGKKRMLIVSEKKKREPPLSPQYPKRPLCYQPYLSRNYIGLDWKTLFLPYVGKDYQI